MQNFYDNKIPEQYETILEAVFACVEDTKQAENMTVAEVLEYLDKHDKWQDLLDFLNDPRVFICDPLAGQDGVVEVCQAYPNYTYKT